MKLFPNAVAGRARKRLAWPFLLLLALTPALLAAPKVGAPAPALAVTRLDGTPFDLAALKGKVVVVNFWATWCPPCRQEMPILDTYYRAHHGNGLEMIALSRDDRRDRAAVEKVMKQFAFPAAMLRDAKTNGFGTPNLLPVTYVIDSSGVVRATFSGKVAVTAAGLAAQVTPLLSKAG